MSPLRIESVLESCLYVDDLEAARAFYGDLLGLEMHSEAEGKSIFFHVGKGMLLVFKPETSMDGAHDRPEHGAHGTQHIAFAVQESSLDAWQERLVASGVTIEQEHIWPHGRRSIYFRDPAGHSIELAPRRLWQAVS